jgi:hypothetical protein
MHAPEYRAADYDCLNLKLKDFRVASFITTLVMNYLFIGKFKRIA